MGSPVRPSTVPPRHSASAKALVGPPEDPRVPLRLTVTRGALGMELYEPIEIGPLSVERLSLTFAGLRFPVDLSGGVPRFRSRRGELQEVVLRLRLADLARFAGKRAGEPFGPLVKPLAVWGIPGGVGVGLVGEKSALAFELLWAADGGAARFVVSHARGIGLAAPALTVALGVCDAVIEGFGQRRGRVVTISDVGGRIGRALLPAVGARAPTAAAVSFGDMFLELDELLVALDATFPPAAASDAATRALELSRLTREADDALAESRLDEAREKLLEALEQAPRQPEIVRTVCELDAAVPGRSEAALGLLVETLPAAAAGAVGAELLLASGDRAGALAALERGATEETFAPLAALLLERAATVDAGAQVLHYLDRAVAAAPTLAHVHQARLDARLARGDVHGALADAEHLEAMASGAAARHAVCAKAAASLLDAGFVKEAGRAFERALRYMPDDARATSGLGRALLAAGLTTRAISLFERAITLSERRGQVDGQALVELSRLLAEQLADLPQAVARARQVPADAPEAEVARHLEGLYRSRIGDRVGASLAFARLRETIELNGSASPATLARLRDAARFEIGERDDLSLAERHLALALRLAPSDAELAAEYRRAAELLDQRQRQRQP
ncbi:MAG TPA: tetratricopeptide repeat protein [Polyangiaceae bacterium]|nr:tetratricopeptide repeat protein [Polyangiaceae bacterium]